MGPWTAEPCPLTHARRRLAGSDPSSVDGSAWQVLERLVDDEEQQRYNYEGDRDRLAESDHYASDPEYGCDQA